MENYYIDVLGLSVEKFISDITELNTILEKKNNEWKSSNNTSIRAKSDKYYVSGVVKTAYTNSSEWKKIYETAKKKVDSDIRMKLNIQGGKGYITEAEIASTAKTNKVSIGYVERFMIELGLTKGEKPKSEPKSAYKIKLDDYKPKTTLVFKEPAEKLKLINCSDYYDFLTRYTAKINNSGTSMIFSADIDAGRCVSAAKNIESAWAGKKEDEEKSAIDKICTSIKCFDKSNNNESKDNYDKYLVWKQIKEVLDTLWRPLAGSDENSRIIDEKVKGEFVNRLIEVVESRSDAESILFNYCAQDDKKIKIKGATAGLVVCPFCSNSFERVNGKIPEICPSCHKSFLMECPECHKTINYAETRKCGSFNFDIYPRVIKKCNEVHEFVDRLYLDYAEQQLAEIDKLWPGFPETKHIREELQSRKKIVGTTVTALNKFIRERNFYAASNEYNNLKRAFAGYSDVSIEERINTAITEARNLFSLANSETDNSKKIRLFIKVKQCVNDFPGIDSALEKIPPEPIIFLKSTVNMNNKSITLNWNSKDDEGTVEYILLRKEDGKPVSYNDGDVLIKTTEKGYTDHSAKPGKLYYYAVYAERGRKSNIVSLTEPELLYPDIDTYKSSPDEQMIHILWNVDLGSMKAEVYRCDKGNVDKYGEGIRITEVNDKGFVDTKLETGKKYFYNVFFVMTTSTRKYISAPFSISCETVKKGKPVIFKVAETQEKGKYEIEITEGSDNDGTIQFYSSVTDNLIKGTGIEVKQLSSVGLVRVNTIKLSNNKYTFDLAEGEAKYIYAVNVNGSNATIWESEYVVNFQNIKVKSMRNNGVDLFIELESWPEKQDLIYVVHSCDKQPTSIKDVNSFKQNVTKANYNASGIQIRNIEEKNYYITGFIRADGDYIPIFKTTYENGKKIELRYSFSKNFFGTFKVNITMSEPSELPALVVRYGMGTLPVYDGTGMELCQIPKDSASKTHFVYEISKATNVKKGMKGRLFFAEKDDKNKYQLMLAEGCSPDLTGN